MADHLSRLELNEIVDEACIQEEFPDEHILSIQANLPWHADLVNYLACGVLPPDLTPHMKKKLLKDVKWYIWDEPFLFKKGADQVIRRCIAEEEIPNILHHCHASAYGGHFGPTRTAAKVLQSGFYWPTLFRDSYTFVKTCD